MAVILLRGERAHAGLHRITYKNFISSPNEKITGPLTYLCGKNHGESVCILPKRYLGLLSNTTLDYRLISFESIPDYLNKDAINIFEFMKAQKPEFIFNRRF
tara:strand:- start:2618 stop:2923 length:306 start_codon:yes stop_codon:yes gene_type:complete